jgi:hypothetical protein
LTHCRIRYTQPGAFNDPFEVKPYITNIADNETAERVVDQILPDEIKKAYEQLPAEVRSVIPYEVMQKIALQRRELLRGQFGAIISQFTPMLRRVMEEKFNELLGILSLTEKPDNLLMWSHYAASHEGFVIGFDSTHEYFNQRESEKKEFRHLRKVEYRSMRPSMPLAALDGIDIFLVKSVDWEYEQEWRIIFPLENAVEVIPTESLPVCLFAFPPEAVIEVIFGSRMHETNKSAIRNILRSSKKFSQVEIFNALPHEWEFGLKLEKDVV